MISKILRSDTKTGLYIYLSQDSKIEDLPEDLIKLIGKHTEIMELDLTKRKKLANEDITKVKSNLIKQGYHVQMPKDLVKHIIHYGE